MSDSLFDIPPVLSPRLKWMEKYNVKTHYALESDDPPHWCWCGDRDAMSVALGSRGNECFAQADSEDEAIEGHAILRGILLWNEEGAL